MTSMSSYGKISENEQAKLEARKKTKKRIAIIVISSIVLVIIVVGAIVGTSVNSTKKQSKDLSGVPFPVSVKAVCDVTLYKDKCFETVGSAPNASSLNPEELFNYAVKLTITELTQVLDEFSNDHHIDNATSAAMGACVDLLGLAVDQLNETFTSIKDKATSLLSSTDDLRTWLSSVETYQETCLEALIEANNWNLTTFGETHLKNSTEMTSNALAIVTWLGKIADSVKLRRRRLMTLGYTDHLAMREGRRLLESSDLKKLATIVVAKDGSGMYKTISEALKSVEEKNKNRTIIHVKNGVYLENVSVDKNKWNVVMVGDGQDKTIVSAGLNFIDGTPTFQTATFAVFGKGFMAKDMGFRNTAGAAKHQAVALIVSSDLSVFYKCTMDAFQDTLYTHAQRQFYRECNIFGTVDFIFGNAAVVFQHCNIMPRHPLKGQQNTITAQGRTDPNQNTGISIHNCTILPLDYLTGVQTFLGRPWKAYSRTVFMKSFLDGFIDPKGWLPWTGDTAPDTIFYGEYLNIGPGALTKNRVNWKGLKTSLSKKESTKFTVKPFIDGDNWLPATKVPFKSDL